MLNGFERFGHSTHLTSVNHQIQAETVGLIMRRRPRFDWGPRLYQNRWRILVDFRPFFFSMETSHQYPLVN